MRPFESEADLAARGVIGAHDLPPEGSAPFVPKRITLQWHITGRCNLSCRHCYDTREHQDELPLADLRAILDAFTARVAAWNVPAHINITGGEPLCREDLFDLLASIGPSTERFGFGILTNGTRIGPDEARRLKRLGCRFVQVSLEGGEAANDAIRGANSYRDIRRAVRALRRQRIYTMVSFTIGRGNVHAFPEAAYAARDAGADMIWADRAIPLGNAAGQSGESITSDEYAAFLEDMFAIRRRFSRALFSRTRVFMHRALQFQPLLRHGEKNVAPYRCSAGRNLLALMPDGALLPCRRMPIVVGTLPAEGLDEIYYRSALFAKLRRSAVTALGCAGCQHETSCNGGLRCLSYALTGDPFRRDPHCSLPHPQRQCVDDVPAPTTLSHPMPSIP